MLKAVKKFFKRPPDFIIGNIEDPYMLRWWIIPRNKFLNVYLHHFLKSDDDRALHDHPWWSISLILKGEYIEHLPDKKPKKYKRWSLIFRKATHTHRVELHNGKVWTLFITGPKVRNWGFHCPKGWVPWQEFCKPHSKGQIGKGCD